MHLKDQFAYNYVGHRAVNNARVTMRIYHYVKIFMAVCSFSNFARENTCTQQQIQETDEHNIFI